MKDIIYLVVTPRRVDRMLHSKKPKLKGGEVAIKLHIEVDDSNFQPLLAQADLLVPEGMVTQPDATVILEEPDFYEEDESVEEVEEAFNAGERGFTG